MSASVNERITTRTTFWPDQNMGEYLRVKNHAITAMASTTANQQKMRSAASDI